MNVDKLSVSFDRNLARAVRAAAEEGGGGVSRWLAEAATARLRSDALGRFLDQWQRKHGSLTTDELDRAAAELGIVGAAGVVSGSGSARPLPQGPKRALGKVASPATTRPRRASSSSKA